MTNVLLTLIAAVLLWTFVLRDWVEQHQANRRRARQPIAAPTPPPSAVLSESTFTLLLCDSAGANVEHEITLHHVEAAPDTYRYADQTYTRFSQRLGGAWEYRL